MQQMLVGMGGGLPRIDYSAYSSLLTWQHSFKDNFTDASGNGYNITTSSIQISTDYSKHYTASAKFTGGASGSFSTAVWNAMNNTNWTIEFWVYLTSTSMNEGWGSNFLSSRQAGDNSNPWITFGWGGVPDPSQNPRLRLNHSAGGFAANITPDGADNKKTPPNEWIHVGCCKSGSTVRTFYNGKLIDTDTDNNSITVSRGLIGGDDYGAFADYQTFYIQDLRLWTGSGATLYTQDFQPPGAIE